jgi:phage recombination protein Bet
MDPFENSEPDDKLWLMNTTSCEAPQLSTDHIALLKRTLLKNLSEDESALFLRVCERSGLDPFARQIYPVKRKEYSSESRKWEERFQAEATIDGLRVIAERSGKYAGQLGPEWCGKDGVWRDIWLEEHPPLAARVGILRSDFREPVWGKALYAEYVQLNQNGEPTHFWVKMGANQLAKCAEALGFRKAFPRQMSGLYTFEEMQQAGPTPTVQSSQQSEDKNGGSDKNGAHHSLRPAKDPETRTERLQDTTNPKTFTTPPFVRDAITMMQDPENVGGRTKLISETMRQLQNMFIEAAGPAGDKRFYKLTSRLPKIFPTREECAQKTILCWLELCAELEQLKKAEAH